MVESGKTGPPVIFWIGVSEMLDERLGHLERRVVTDWAHLGRETAAKGVRCVGLVPDAGPAAWLHKFYPGCPPVELDQAESRMGAAIPPPVREVLLRLNGLGLFLRGLHLYGITPGGLLRRNPAEPQPLSLEAAYRTWRHEYPTVRSSDYMVGGSGLGDGAYYLLRDNMIVKVGRKVGPELGRWESIAEMLEAEYEALAPRWDGQGHRLDGPQ